MTRSTVLLLSGGLDSSSAAYLLAASGVDLRCLHIAGGEGRHRETESARGIADALRLPVTTMDLSGTALLLESSPALRFAVGGQIGGCVPDPDTAADFSVETMHMCALMHASAVGADSVTWALHSDDLITTTRAAVDRYLDLMCQIADHNYGRAIRIETPFIEMTKRELVQAGVLGGLDPTMTFSCVDPSIDDRSCGSCHQCVMRRDALAAVREAAHFN